jgi:dTDP-4-amino-4,6-dideoxygalactose transaminase
VQPEALATGWDRNRIVQELNKRGLPAFHGSCSEVYLERAFDRTELRPLQRLPAAMELGDTSIALLTHPTLTPEDLDNGRNAIEAVFSEASA